VKVAASIVAAFMAAPKVAVTIEFVGSPVTPLTGVVAITAGTVGAGVVLKFHTVLLASGVPAKS
jgi:uncharacterized MnhB-related membrane protein